MQPRLRPKSKTKMNLTIVLVALSLIALYIAFAPNFSYVESSHCPSLVIGDKAHDIPPLVQDGLVFIPIEAVQTYLDPDLVCEDNQIVITTRDKTLHMRSDVLTAFMNLEPIQLEIPVTTFEGTAYIPQTLIERIYDATLEYHGETGVVTLDKAGVPVLTARLSRVAFLRQDASRKAPIICRLKNNDTLRVYGENRGYYHVRTEKGLTGHVHKSNVVLGTILTPPASPMPPSKPWRPMGQRMNLTWEHVISHNPDPAGIPDLFGVTVVSPTWFSLKDSQGSISSQADEAYIRWAKEKGYSVWPLINNDFNPETTSDMLGNKDARENFIRQLIAFSHLYNFDGINVDFENMYPEDSDNFVQLLRELVPPAHEQGLVVSVDVTPHSLSPTWSLCYDRKSIAQVADYVILMAYDQYGAGSPTPGPVASLPWTESAITRALEEVPAQRLILGIPFYTRIWKEDTQGETTSRAYGMEKSKTFLEERDLRPSLDHSTGLHFAEFEADGVRYSVWLEDETSLENRLDLVNKYGLAGVASWRRGLEAEWVWALIEDRLRGPL